MEEKNVKKISFSSFLLMLAIPAIIIMGIYIYKLSNEKTVTVQRNSELETQVTNLNQTVNNLQGKMNNISNIVNNETKTSNDTKISQNNYLTNFKNSVSQELGQDNLIYINLTDIDYNNCTGYVSVNNKHEAYIYLSNFKEFSSNNNLKKIADNVVNVWYCEQGQAPGNNYIVFLKEDGSVTYVRFKTDSTKTTFESEEKTINGISDISNIIPIEGNDNNGIGGFGVLFIKSDGTCLPYSSLDDLVNNSKTYNMSQNNTNNYLTNFKNSVSQELGNDNLIYINLTDIDYNNCTGYVSVNNKHEAYIYLSNFKEFSSNNNLKKITDNVVNVWYCEQGQAPGNNYIVFLKEDGSVTYVRFKTDNNGKTTFESEEKTINGISDISNIIPIEGNDDTGIGGFGVLFIKSDGTCLPYSTLDNLTK